MNFKIGDRIFVRGYIDEIRKDTVIVRNDGGYFGTVLSEVTGELPSAQPEPCEDAVSREALRKAMYHRAFETDGDTMWQSGCWVRYRAIEQTVKEQPTIEPERKKGKWIVVDDADDSIRISGKCSACGWEAHLYEDDVAGMDYCPNCGARMTEEDV